MLCVMQCKLCDSLFEVSGDKYVVVVDVEFTCVGDPLAEFAGVGLAEGHYVPRSSRV